MCNRNRNSHNASKQKFTDTFNEVNEYRLI